MSSAATGNDLIDRYDVDMIGDLATDDRESLYRDDVPTNSKVLAALNDARGEIEVALAVGNRYLPSQLTSLSGGSLQHLIRVECDIAMSNLFRRRGGQAYMETAESVAKTARGHLEQLRRGENVFAMPEVQASSTMDLATISTIDIDQMNLLPSRMPRYFPNPLSRIPRRA